MGLLLEEGIEIDSELARIYRDYCDSDQAPILTSEDFAFLCSCCETIAASQNRVWIEQYYHMLLMGMYNSERYGRRNHFTKLRNHLYKLCPEECNDLETRLRKSLAASKNYQ